MYFCFCFFFFLSSFSFSLPMHPNMAWVCCWLSSLPRECSSSSQNVVEEEPVGMLPQKSYLFCVYIYIFFIEYRALICKILGYRAVVEFVWKLRLFGRNSLKRAFFHVYAEGNSQGSSIHFDPTSENLSSLLPTAVWISKICLAGVRWSYYTNTI